MNSSRPSDAPLGPDFELGPELDAMELREFEIISVENKDAVIEFETGAIEWDSGPRGTFRFLVDIADLHALAQQCVTAAREFSAENYAIAVAKLKKPPAATQT